MREMGVLITAITVAGRSGSAFTAEIDVMKSRTSRIRIGSPESFSILARGPLYAHSPALQKGRAPREPDIAPIRLPTLRTLACFDAATRSAQPRSRTQSLLSVPERDQPCGLPV
jgi:hypothetical protein